MPKYSQPKMFHVGNIPTMDQEQFGEFWNCLSIFLNSTKLQKNRKRKTGRNLTWRLLTGPLAGPAQLPRQRAAWLGQAGRQVLGGEHRMGATHLVTASPLPSPSRNVDRSTTLPRTPRTSPLLPSSSPSRSPAMAEATAATPSP